MSALDCGISCPPTSTANPTQHLITCRRLVRVLVPRTTFSDMHVIYSLIRLSLAMHPCWSVSEITREVVEWVLASPGQYASLKTLCSLARTCKAVQDVALDGLWRTQDTLTNLVKCLPEATWTSSEGQIVSRIWSYIFKGHARLNSATGCRGGRGGSAAREQILSQVAPRHRTPARRL